MTSDKAPGVKREDVFPQPPSTLLTGIPAFLGYATTGDANVPQTLTLWQQFSTHFGSGHSESYLGASVRGFFENGGQQCVVVRLEDEDSPVTALTKGLDAIAPLDTIDLVCVPDIMLNRADADLVRVLQTEVIKHCDQQRDRMAILDALPGGNIHTVLEQVRELSGENAALYFPWLGIGEGDGVVSFIPPCGHVAGIYARSDARIGVHKAPANEELQGVVDVEINLSDAQQGLLNPEGVNAIRAFPGRGIRVWGARTINREQEWIYVNVRRLFLTLGRWIDRNLASAVFEPNDARLWARITRELTAYCNGLYQRGALRGKVAQDAFYVKCDAETNPSAVRDDGQVITNIGLAPVIQGEFITVRIIHGASGVTLTDPVA